MANEDRFKCSAPHPEDWRWEEAIKATEDGLPRWKRELLALKEYVFRATIGHYDMGPDEVFYIVGTYVDNKMQEGDDDGKA